jgi:hypothetical protein
MTSLLVIALLSGSIAASAEDTVFLLDAVSTSAEDSVFLDKGKAAPFSGILFTEEKAKQLRVDLLDGDKYKIQLETEKNRTERLLTIQHLKDEEIELYRKQNERLLKVNDRSDTMNYIWFGLGVLATGLAVYGAAGLAR